MWPEGSLTVAAGLVDVSIADEVALFVATLTELSSVSLRC